MNRFHVLRRLTPYGRGPPLQNYTTPKISFKNIGGNIMKSNNEKFYNYILAALNELYSEELKRKIETRKKANALQCRFNGGLVPFGYSINERQGYVIDPFAAPVVVEVFERYADGQSVRDIHQTLNNRGVSLTAGRIRRLLKNRIYIGEYRYTSIAIANGVPAIISNQLFEQAQRILKRKRPRRTKKMDCIHNITPRERGPP